MGACFEVYLEMGCGFTEPIYQEFLEIELGLQTIPLQAQHELRLVYKTRQLKKKFESDFLCYDRIVVEIKAWRHSPTSTGLRFTMISRRRD